VIVSRLSGDALQRWMDAPPLAVCNRCGRQTWAATEAGREDRMTQPDGNPCGGMFREDYRPEWRPQ
jgi:hypothetical protein